MQTPMQQRNSAILSCREILANPDDYGILDTETTGLRNAEVIEIAVIDPSGNQLINRFVFPKSKCQPKALEVHGLSNEVLTEKGATTWPDICDEVSDALAGRTAVIYNAPYDVGVLENTDRFHGTQTYLEGAKALCIMRLYQDFTGSSRWAKLEGGDHTALGDCQATLALIRRMAVAEVQEDTTKPTTIEQFTALQRRIDKLSWDKRQLEKEEKELRAVSTQYMLDNKHESLMLASGKTAQLITSQVKFEMLRDPMDMPIELVDLKVNTRAVKEAIAAGQDLSEVVSWQESHYVKFTKVKS